MPITDGCDIGLPSTPVDSSTVVALGYSKLSAMAGFDAASAELSAANFYDCSIFNGNLENRQDWEVSGYWHQPEGIFQGIVNFDSAGHVSATRGPCPFGDRECLGAP